MPVLVSVAPLVVCARCGAVDCAAASLGSCFHVVSAGRGRFGEMSVLVLGAGAGYW